MVSGEVSGRRVFETRVHLQSAADALCPRCHGILRAVSERHAACPRPACMAFPADTYPPLLASDLVEGQGGPEWDCDCDCRRCDRGEHSLCLDGAVCEDVSAELVERLARPEEVEAELARRLSQARRDVEHHAAELEKARAELALLNEWSRATQRVAS